MNENGENKKLDWMYKGANSLVEREEYLLGRSVDKTLEQLNQEEKEKKLGLVPPKNHVEHECIPPSIRDFNKIIQAEQVDLSAKLQEDPLVAIKKREEEARRQFLQNPIQLKKLQEALKVQEMKNNKKSKHLDSDSDLDRKIVSKLKQLKGNNQLAIGTTKKQKKKHKSDALDIILMHKYNQFKDKLSQKDLDDILAGKTSSSSDSEENEESSMGKRRKQSSSSDDSYKHKTKIAKDRFVNGSGNGRKNKQEERGKNDRIPPPRGRLVERTRRKGRRSSTSTSSSSSSSSTSASEDRNKNKKNHRMDNLTKKSNLTQRKKERGSSSEENKRKKRDTSNEVNGRRDHADVRKQEYDAKNVRKKRAQYEDRRKDRGSSSDDENECKYGVRKKHQPNSSSDSDRRKTNRDIKGKQKKTTKYRLEEIKRKNRSEEAARERIKPRSREQNRNSSSEGKNKKGNYNKDRAKEKNRRNDSTSSSSNSSSTEDERSVSKCKREDKNADRHRVSKKDPSSSSSSEDTQKRKENILNRSRKQTGKSNSDHQTKKNHDTELDRMILQKLRMLRDSKPPEPNRHQTSDKNKVSAGYDSDSDKEVHKVRSFGLVKADGTKIPLNRKPYEPRATEPKKTEPAKRPEQKKVKKLSEAEKEELRRQMMKDAEKREKERSENLRKYREEDRREEIARTTGEFDKNFVHKEMLKSTKDASVESRIRSNLNNIQRSSQHMTANFSRRT